MAPVVEFSRGVSHLSDIDLGPAGNSVQLLFAKLQLSQSALCKDEAVKRMNEVQAVQKFQKDIAAKLAEARRLQEVAKEKGTAEATKEFVDFCTANGIELPKPGEPVTTYKLNAYMRSVINDFSVLREYMKGKDPDHMTQSEIEGLVAKARECGYGGRPLNLTIDGISTKEVKPGGYTEKQWGEIIKILTDRREMTGSGTQTAMVYLQDFIGQYNSFLQGANSAIATANQVLTSIAKGQ